MSLKNTSSPLPDPSSKLSLLVETLESIHYRSKDDIVYQASKVFLENISSLEDPLLVLSPLNQNLFVQLLDAIFKSKDRNKLLSIFVPLITPDLMTSETLSLVCSSMLSVLPFSSTGKDSLLPIVLTSFTNLSRCRLHDEVYSLLISCLFDLHVILLPNAPEAQRVKDLIQTFIDVSPQTPMYSNGIPPVVTLLTTSAKYSTDDWCSPDAVHVKSDNKYMTSVNFSSRIRSDIEKHREEKIKFVKTLSNENQKYFNSRAHAHAVKCILLIFTIADHHILQQYDDWKKPLIDCLIANGFTTEPQKYIPTLKIFIEVMSSPILHVKGLSVIFERLYLFILNSSLSTPQQKQLTLEMLVSLTEKQECIISMFQLYDCSIVAPNVIRSLVKTLSDVVYGKIKSIEKFVSKQFDTDNRMRALKCILNIIDNISTIQINYSSLPSTIEQRMERKVLLENGFPLFANNPKDGVEYFVSNKFCENSSRSIADFLLSTQGLDKRRVTEYISNLGNDGNDALNKLIKEIDFSGERFDDALQRMFLMFCAPGEVQIVDNIIERFSVRYAECNAALNMTPEQIYLLATSVMCVALDTKTKRITFKQFSEMIGNVGNINIDIKGLFQRAASGSFALAECLTGIDSNIVNDLEVKERVLRTLSGIDANMIRIYQTKEEGKLENSIDVIKAFIKSTLISCTDICRYLFFNEETGDFVENSLRGMQKLIHITAYCGMSECDDLTSDISLWTMLLSPEEMTPKHVLAIRYIINICKEEGPLLKNAWLSCLKVISHLDNLGLMPKPYGDVSEVKVMPKPQHQIYYPEYLGIFTFVNNGLRVANKKFDQKTLTTLKQLLQKHLSVINDIFIKEAVAPNENFLCFLNSLKTVIMTEINTLSPQYFLFNILIQILLMIVGREQNIISQALIIACDIYVRAGLHPHCVLAKQAVKALGLLQSKFPQNDIILNSLMIIMADSAVPQVRDAIIETIESILDGYKPSQKMNWKAIINILNLAALDSSPNIIIRGFSSFRLLTIKTFDEETQYLITKGLQLYSKNCSNEKMTRDLVALANSYLQEKKQLTEVMYIWGGIIGSNYVECSVEAMKYLLIQLESNKSEMTWNVVYTQIVPLIYNNIEKKDKEWITTVGMTFALNLSSFIANKKVPIRYIEVELMICHILCCSPLHFGISVSGLLVQDIIEVVSHHDNCCDGFKLIMELVHSHIAAVVLKKVNLRVKTSKSSKEMIGIIKCSACNKEFSSHLAFICPYCKEHYYCSLECQKKKEINHLPQPIVNHYETFQPTDNKTLLTCDLKIFIVLKEMVHDIASHEKSDEMLQSLQSVIDEYSSVYNDIEKTSYIECFGLVVDAAIDCFISLSIESSQFTMINLLFKMTDKVISVVCDKLLQEHTTILNQMKSSLNLSVLPNTSQAKKLKLRFDSL
ncbi:guanyl-nucleotide exchange factor, putative [Entamoeba dispar SAW760]|uniref:Guanyl-nucleotide exchange factor, putative n=1 Tax=Entamoeba dispar (strain ATCC PRA-260 / SAW760) TaxID=370354 RepID=B0ETT7_ENTDS|nr:guanyl-nucleotide exchange factor, putative [Entamoeba dispar SAW760]EDR22013.1 guanyl-nucleotide exchange factor, putative [Entamoeba dispar SAW760]|eukprot:EDR22013.1 guanyl-nucleotide exchange factor, putative [Entamoeba dispar SAW760]